MAEGLQEPVTLAVYALGILGAAYHLANGIWQASIGWGFTVTQAGMRRVQWISMAAFLVLLAMGYAAVWGFVRS
jgi:succinate dehydrogenase / fumarate reductase cytochrome b subunit